jgi:hypothetical protein
LGAEAETTVSDLCDIKTLFIVLEAEAETTVSDLCDIKTLFSLLFLRSFILDITVLPVILQHSKGEKGSVLYI